MKLAAAILTVIRLWDHPCPPPDEPGETAAEYQVRLETMSEADAAAAREVSWSWGRVIAAAGVAVVWHAESRFDFYIHAGIPNPNPSIHEDHGLARCMGSLHENLRLPHERWLAVAGTSLEATTRCALETALALRSSAWTCAQGLPPTEHAFALVLEHYARGHCAEPGPESRRRAARWMHVTARLGQLTKKGRGS